MNLVFLNGALQNRWNDYDWSDGDEIPTFRFSISTRNDVLDLVDTTADTRSTYEAHLDGDDQQTWVKLGTVLDDIVEAIR